MAHVYKLPAGVLGHFWRNQSGITVRSGSIGVDMLDRSFLCRTLVFVGVVRSTIAIQTCRTGVPGLEDSPLPLLDGGELISKVDYRDWDGFLWAVPKKRTSHSKKRMRMTHKYLKPIQHYTTCPKCQNLKLLHVLCIHCLKETLKKTAAMRQEEQRTYKQ